MNENTRHGFIDPPTPPPEVRKSKSPCGHGRSPKDKRGSRNERLRGKIMTSLLGGQRVSR